MDSVITIPAFGDNYIYLCPYNKSNAFAVDPCDNSLVQQALKKHALNLTTILITHHHWDHTGGVVDLKKKTGCEVVGPDKRRIPAIDRVVADDQVLTIGNIKIQVIATPGHTSTSVCYYMQPTDSNEPGVLWTGDTLFVNGCGRILETDAGTMLDSLLKLAKLPDDTLVYCGHNYTVENYEFALTIEPDNEAVKERLREVKKTTRAVPSTIMQEKTTNPFLRSDTPGIKAGFGMPNAGTVEVFAEMRRRKDVF
ncbi:MAG: hydroxyacylglutathione hydrolase [Planctomycetota bacterium]